MDGITVEVKKRELRQRLEEALLLAAAIFRSSSIRPAGQRKFREILRTLGMLEKMVW